MDEFADLIALSRFAGERFDLVQAGGGNSSRRCDDGRLHVKASGMSLAAVASAEDFCTVSWPPLLAFLDQDEAATEGASDIAVLEARANAVVNAAMLSSGRRPSIETLLHCALGNFTLHTHPIAVTAVVCAANWKERLTTLFADAFFVDYKTPGPALALALRRQLRERDWQPGDPACVFLQNHGLIVAADRKKAVIDMTNDVVERIAGSIDLNLGRYRLVNFTSQLINNACGSEWISYLSEDEDLVAAAAGEASALLSAPLTPDQLVYCGPVALVLESIEEAAATEAVTAYFMKFQQPPRVILLKDGSHRHVLLAGQNLHKCRDTEAVLKSVVLMLSRAARSSLQLLSKDEVDFLTNWEAEKYRQRL
ncbi:MAG: class II aldolase/adducin family protein [Cyanobacteria bacterium REEB67]|nr:class II aldolase/adducin family protein [Cyanobacteria bacterium REEB67]